MKKYTFILSMCITLLLLQSSSVFSAKFLFDYTKNETAGNADWIIDNNYPIPSPDQSGITSSTSESYWTGGISAWGVDLVKRGHTVHTLTSTYGITYGNTSNPYDLSNYNVFIMCEPQNQLSSAEKTAIRNFVQNGGGFFMVADHNASDRDNDGWDSPHIFNDMGSGTYFGITFDYVSITGNYSYVENPKTTITNGPAGNVNQISYNAGTSMTVSGNAKGHVWTASSYIGGTTKVVFATSTYGNGKIAAWGDSSPTDDGTGQSGNDLYNGWTASGMQNNIITLNACEWLIGGSTPPVDTTPPTFAGLQSATDAGTGGKINLSWNSATDPSTPITYYIYQATTSGGQNYSSPNYTTTSLTYSVTGLTNGTTYYFVVRAKDNAGNIETNTVQKSATPTTGSGGGISYIVFSEVMYDPTTEPAGEWIELYNPTTSAFNIGGWSITDNGGTFTIPTGIQIAPNSYLVIANSATEFQTRYGFNPDVSGLTLGLGNSGDYLILKNSSSTVIDQVAWESGGSSISGWGSTSMPVANDGKSIVRASFTSETNTYADWLSDQTPNPQGQTTTCTDTFEPNETTTNAYGPITSGTTYNSKICSTTDVDYYKFTTGSSGNINIYCTVPSGKDYDVELYDSSITKVASGTNGTGTAENFNYTGPAGTYYVKVLGHNGVYDITNTYGLKATYPGVDNPPTCSITNPANGASIAQGTTVNITASATDDNGISKIEIYVDGALKVSDTSSPYEYSWSTAGLTGSHTIYAKAFDTINQSTQSSTVTVSITTSTCTDSYEPNDSFSAAYSITSGTTYNGKICSGTDVDYFKFSLTATGSITVNCTVPSGKDYDVYLYNPSQNKVASGTAGAGVTENFTYNATVTGTYYVYVFGYSGVYDVTNAYGLKVTWGSSSCSDTYEPNDSFSAAYSNLTSGTNYTSKICSGSDVDYYKFSISTTGTITVFCDVPSDKDYDVNLYDSSQTLKAAGTAATGVDENFSHNATTTGTWYIKVFGYSGAYSTTSSYILRVTYPTSTGVASITFKPSVYSLEQNYPNPFNPETIIRYAIAGDRGQGTGDESFVTRPSSLVTLRIYNITGQLIRTLVNEEQSAGYYSVIWDGRDDNGKSVASGMYFYTLKTDNFTSTKKMILAK